MEIWKDIKGYEGLYQVSNEGRVKSLARWIDGVNYGKPCKKFRREKLMKTRKDRRGYIRVMLCKNTKHRSYQVHRLVYAAFGGDIPKGLQVNHIDENKENNQIGNLNIMTPKENTNWGTGRKRAAEKCKKKVYQYDKNNTLVNIFDSVKEACEKYNISQGNISSCCLGKMKTYKGYRWSYSPL